MMMTYPGLPEDWGIAVLVLIAIIGLWLIISPQPRPQTTNRRKLYFSQLPVVGKWIHRMTTSPWPLLSIRILITAIFLLIIIAGLSGSQIPQRNIATLFTWNIWWTGVIISIFFAGSAWCAICPWDALAHWLVKRRLWRRAPAHTSLNLRVPRPMRNIFPALILFIGLSWLELGVGITTNPYTTALMALLMVVMATVSMLVFERNAFCRYFCPVGRTIGCYSQLAPIELRPINTTTCANCTTLDCYHGNENIDPCPTWLVMGRIQQNSYCTSCGNCSLSCPQQNIDWRLRQPGSEALQGGRPHWDEAWFMLGLLALTGFHGITMMPFWKRDISQLAQLIGDSGQLLWSFTIGLLICLLAVISFYALAVKFTHIISRADISYQRLFASLAFVTLPLAFAYHVAHNLTHLVRESSGVGGVILNPFGTNTQPVGMAEMHQRMISMMISPATLHAIQAGLIVAGFLLAVQIIRYRFRPLKQQSVSLWAMLPIALFAAIMSGFHLWLLMQPMVMRM